MSISTQRLYDAARARHGADSSDQRFISVFFDALRCVKGEVEVECRLDFDMPTVLTDDIEIDEKHHSTISTGLKFHIANHGEWMMEDSSKIEKYYRQAKKVSQMAAHQDEGNEGKLGDQS